MNLTFAVTAGNKMSLVGLLSATAGFVKVRFLGDKEVIDNVIFRLHYHFTSAVLFVCCILCTANSLIGESLTTANINEWCHIWHTFRGYRV
jgi:hypothetical protein